MNPPVFMQEMLALTEFGLKSYPWSEGKLSLWTVLKSNGRKKQEKRGGISTSEAAKFLV